MAKAHTTITIDSDIWDIAKAKNINLSGLINGFLRNYFIEKSFDDRLPISERVKEQNIIIAKAKAELEALELESKNIETEQQKKDKLEKWIEHIIKLVKESKDWRAYINGYRNIIKVQTGIILPESEILEIIEKRLKDGDNINSSSNQ